MTLALLLAFLCAFLVVTLLAGFRLRRDAKRAPWCRVALVDGARPCLGSPIRWSWRNRSTWRW